MQAGLNGFSAGKWVHFTSPFSHFRAEQLLCPASYDRIATAYDAILGNTENNGPGHDKLRKSMENYDARMLAIDSRIAAMFQPLFDVDWIKWLCDLCEIPFIAHIDAALHSSLPGSRTGWIHTDLCSAWFDEGKRAPKLNELFFPDRTSCDYFTGRIKKDGCNPVEYIRAATIIVYLCNDGWTARDGGETALYSSLGKRADINLISPVNNSALVFRCSPHSYHRFISNPSKTRNSIIFWLHTTAEYGMSLWGSAITRRSAQ